MLLPLELPDILRARGIKVELEPGWATRWTDPSPFAPVGNLWHHTAIGPSASDAAVNGILRAGRSDLRGPLSQGRVKRDGTVRLIARGRAHHAGTARAMKYAPGGDGNTLYVGWEFDNDGVGERYPEAQYEAGIGLFACMQLDVLKVGSAKTVYGHRETSVTGKIDPKLDMNVIRSRVDARILDFRRPPKTRGQFVDNALIRLNEAKGEGRRLYLIRQAKKALREIDYV